MSKYLTVCHIDIYLLAKRSYLFIYFSLLQHPGGSEIMLEHAGESILEDSFKKILLANVFGESKEQSPLLTKQFQQLTLRMSS